MIVWWRKEEWENGRKEVEAHALPVLTLGLHQIIKFMYNIDNRLGEGCIVVKLMRILECSGWNNSFVTIQQRSLLIPTPTDVHVSVFSSGDSSPKLQILEFCLTLRFVYFIVWA
jgi:hypothetical protein